jgi:hypothetical protein
VTVRPSCYRDWVLAEERAERRWRIVGYVGAALVPLAGLVWLTWLALASGR